MKAIKLSTSDPLVVGGKPRKSYTRALTSYTHTLQANGGFWSARAGLTLERKDVEDWFANGLMRDIKTYNASGILKFSGFVNQVTIGLGGLSATRGPVLDISNKVKLGYSTIDASVTPPLVGVRDFTDWVQDTNSQAKFGVLERVLSTGGITQINAETIVLTYVGENRFPRTSESVNTGQGGQLSVMLDILGYIHLSKKYIYNSTSTGLGNLSSKLNAVISTEPNGIFSATPSITENTEQVPLWENDNKTGWDLLWDLVSRGDSLGNRYILGMYKDEKIEYRPIEYSVSYNHRLSDSAQIKTPTNTPIDPIDVLPGKWLFIPDFLAGRSPVFNDPLQDPRMLFIESATYTAPNGLQVQGGNISKVQNLIGNWGISGIGS